MSRELHIITERTKTERIPSVLKTGQTEVRFSSGVGFGLGFLSPMIGERDGAREGGTEGERGRDTQRQREGGREILTAEEKKFLLPPCESERVAEWRARGGERDGRRDRGGGERESEGEGGREILTAEEKKNSSSAPREIEGGGREGGRGRETKTEREGGGREGGKGEREG